VSLPERQYQLAGEILASALEEAATTGVPVQTAVANAAQHEARRVASHARETDHPDLPSTDLEGVAGVLASQGYEPRIQDTRVTLANCPFHALSQQHKDLVCGMNLEFIVALTDELGFDALDARLDPAEGRCCVTLGAG
jgi:predicted ArsR family transcriptional regulator